TDVAAVGGDRAVVAQGRADEGHAARTGLDAAVVAHLVGAARVVVETVEAIAAAGEAGVEVVFADPQGGRHQPAHVHHRVGAEGDAGRIDDEHAAVGAEVAVDLRHGRAVAGPHHRNHPVEGDSVGR